jgi:hypothetical protein
MITNGRMEVKLSTFLILDIKCKKLYIQAPVALPPAEDYQVVRQEASLIPETVWTLWREEKRPCRCWKPNQVVRRVDSHYNDLSISVQTPRNK